MLQNCTNGSSENCKSIFRLNDIIDSIINIFATSDAYKLRPFVMIKWVFQNSGIERVNHCKIIFANKDCIDVSEFYLYFHAKKAHWQSIIMWKKEKHLTHLLWFWNFMIFIFFFFFWLLVKVLNYDLLIIQLLFLLLFIVVINIGIFSLVVHDVDGKDIVGSNYCCLLGQVIVGYCCCLLQCWNS